MAIQPVQINLDNTKSQQPLKQKKEKQQSMSTDSKLYAEYLPKPDGYKTVNQWRKEGMRPKSSEVFEEFAGGYSAGRR